MNREQESQGFRHEQSSHNIHQHGQGFSTSPPPQNKNASTIRHVYLQEENIYGRFAPFLLLKNKLKSDVDSTGNTVLHHMCSHDSPYLPLYLSTIENGDPILNQPSKMGHKPLDVAGIYCRKQYVQLLKQKGAVDSGNVDHWAIQGGNIQNWTGNVDISQKHLIHWASYNDMPQVLKQFHKKGADMDCKDGNNCTPMDLAVINKSYNSIKTLAQLGFRPQHKLLQQCQSKSIKQTFRKLDESSTRKKINKIIKLQYVPLYIALNIYLVMPISSIMLLIFVLFNSLYWMFLATRSVQPEARYEQGRASNFYSDLIQKQVNLKQNHLQYVILIICLFALGCTSIIISSIYSYLSGLIFWVLFVMTLSFGIDLLGLLVGIVQNLTHRQMYNSNQCKHLWKKVRYIQQRQMFTRKYQNSFNKGVKQNVRDYLNKSL